MIQCQRGDVKSPEITAQPDVLKTISASRLMTLVRVEKPNTNWVIGNHSVLNNLNSWSNQAHFTHVIGS